MEQKLQLFRVLFVHNVQLILQHAEDTVRRAVDLCDLPGVERRADHAVGAGVDDGGGSAGLPENAGADQFLAHEKASKIYSRKIKLYARYFLIMR